MDIDIDAAHYRLATGEEPINDDLERSNCARAGEFSHSCCGWCVMCDLPVFICGHQTARK